jgi:gluconate kinase
VSYRVRDYDQVGSTAIVVTGPPGAGKSSVLERLTTLLEIEGVAFGALESEQLSWGSPWLDSEPWLAQLAAVMRLQREAGRSLFLVAATTETSDELTAVHDAIAGDRRITVLLEASSETLASRLAAREPDLWPGKQPLIDHAQQLATQMRGLEGINIRLQTDGRDVTGTAAMLREALLQLGAW